MLKGKGPGGTNADAVVQTLQNPVVLRSFLGLADYQADDSTLTPDIFATIIQEVNQHVRLDTQGQPFVDGYARGLCCKGFQPTESHGPEDLPYPDPVVKQRTIMLGELAEKKVLWNGPGDLFRM